MAVYYCKEKGNFYFDIIWMELKLYMMEDNVEFLEKYKLLDKFIIDAYSSEKGVTYYIDTMVNITYETRKNINMWDSDLKNLKRYRYIRNQLSHNPQTMYENVCTCEDIIWLGEFYGRLLRASDPLALLRKNNNTKKQNVYFYPYSYSGNINNKSGNTHYYTENKNMPYSNKKNNVEDRRTSGGKLLICLISIIVIIFYIIVFTYFL